jgi:5-methylcytosine-specific restriction endonuclease McrA
MVARNSQQQERMRKAIAATRAACHICGAPIDYRRPYYLPGTHTPDPEAFVVDHVIPIARGGKHDLSNARAAHAGCNSKKRARLIAPIVKRSQTLN